MSELPKGWVETNSDELFVQLRGVSYQKDDANSVDEQDGVLILRGGNVQDGKIVNNTDDVYVPTRLVNNDQILRKGDVIIVSSTGSQNLIGKAASSLRDETKIAFGAFLTMLRPTPLIDSLFFGYFYQTEFYRTSIRLLSGGVNINNIRKSHLAEIRFPLPPLAEQERIVEKLNALFASLDVIKDKLDRIPELLKNFRQQVLTQAVTGKLTEEWREGINDYDWTGILGELNSFSKEKIEQSNLSDSNRIKVRLSQISSKVSVGHVGKTSEFYTNEENGIPFIRSQNVKPGKVVLEGVAHITTEFHKKLKKSKLQAGDLLVVRVGANRGDATILPQGLGEINCANIVFARPYSGFVKFLNIYFQSDFWINQVDSLTTGTAQGVINTKIVENVELELPPIEEQQEIVRRVEALFAIADRVEAQYTSLKEKVDQLPQAILAKAFRGELVEQDEEDESAEVLLRRIKEERSNPAPAKKKGYNLSEAPITLAAEEEEAYGE